MINEDGFLASTSCLALLHRPAPASAPASRSTGRTGPRPRPASVCPPPASRQTLHCCHRHPAVIPRHCCCHRHLTDLATASCAVVARPSDRACREPSTRPGMSLSAFLLQEGRSEIDSQSEGQGALGNDDDTLLPCSAASDLCALAVWQRQTRVDSVLAKLREMVGSSPRSKKGARRRSGGELMATGACVSRSLRSRSDGMDCSTRFERRVLCMK